MALKGDRQINATEIGFFLDEVANRGVVVSYGSVGSGVALDSTRNVATVAAVASGTKPIGFLLNDFVNIDRTRQPLNWHKDQHASGDKCTILTKGWVVTDQVAGTPTVGQAAVLYNGGQVSGITLPVSTWNQSSQPLVGRFLSSKDENGFARVQVDL